MAETSKKFNIFQKLQKCRIEVQSAGISKTGKGYGNFGYFELGDFLPTVNVSCEKNGLTPIFKFEKDSASLTIVDNDEPEKNIVFSSPIEMAVIIKGSAIQQIGATQTYARRYLYMMAFEIAEADIVDKVEPDLEKEEGLKKIGKVQLSVLRGIIEETESDEKKFCDFIGVDKLESICNRDYPTCLKQLDKKKEEYYRKHKLINEQKKQQEELQEELKNNDEDFDF